MVRPYSLAKATKMRKSTLIRKTFFMYFGMGLGFFGAFSYDSVWGVAALFGVAWCCLELAIFND